MAKLIYLAIASLDGCIEDEDGKFDWGEPDEEVHAYINDLVRPVGTYLYGRRLYEAMAVWEQWDLADEPPVIRDFAELWRAADKVVYSSTLEAATTPRTRLERRFDPEEVSRLKAGSERDLTIGGAELAAHAFETGQVDEVQLLLAPVVVGGGKRCLPEGVRVRLELLSERGFDSGFVHLRYGIRDQASVFRR
jgi:dihydrofolate reductase